MEAENENNVEALLPGYFAGKLSSEEKQQVEAWKNSSEGNRVLFEEYQKLWNSIGLLDEMEQIDTLAALDNVNHEIEKVRGSHKFIRTFSRVAAILILPLLVYALVVTFNNKNYNGKVAWQTISTKSGMQGRVELPDGSHVLLNSNSEIQYPTSFANNIREVKLKGEAFFEVTKDARHPFIVNTGSMNVEVLGTTFNVTNYAGDKSLEVVLETGSVNLFAGSWENKTDIGKLKPGQRAVFDNAAKLVSINDVEVEKYLAWKEGYVLFREDSMQEVAHRLERWFNVEIIIQDKEINDYLITAKFHQETLSQVLELLKLSSRIEYSVVKSQPLKTGAFTKTKIYIKKQK